MAKAAILSKAYRNSGTYESPTWVEVPQFENVTLNAGWDMADANSRESRAKMGAPTQVDVGVTARMIKRPGNANYEAIMDAVFSGDPVDMMFLDGAHTEENNRGIRADYHFALSEDQGIANILYEDLTGTPGDSNTPRYVKITGGVPVYTEFT